MRTPKAATSAPIATTPRKALLTVASLTVIAVTARRTVARDVRECLSRPTALLFIIGFLLVAVWGQVLGQRDLWRELQRGQAAASKRLVEEGLEAAGYCFILFGIVEECLDLLVLSRQKGSRSLHSLLTSAPHFSQCDRIIDRDQNVAE